MKKNIAVVQMNVHVKDTEYNYKNALCLLQQAAQLQPDIIVLPETWNTGFYPSKDLLQLADTNGEHTKDMLGNFAHKYNVNILGGSVTTNYNGQIYNTSYAFNRAGDVVGTYNKIHCFTPAKEDLYFKGGEEISKFYFDGIPCSMVTCYDIRFPELVRMAALQDIHVLFIPAQWPTMRLNHWITLSTARAIENQLYVCAVNGCGKIGKAQCAGNSLLIDPWGKELLHLEDHEAIALTTIDIDIINDIRSKINIFDDRKPYLYKL